MMFALYSNCFVIKLHTQFWQFFINYWTLSPQNNVQKTLKSLQSHPRTRKRFYCWIIITKILAFCIISQVWLERTKNKYGFQTLTTISLMPNTRVFYEKSFWNSPYTNIFFLPATLVLFCSFRIVRLLRNVSIHLCQYFFNCTCSWEQTSANTLNRFVICLKFADLWIIRVWTYEK